MDDYFENGLKRPGLFRHPVVRRARRGPFRFPEKNGPLSFDTSATVALLLLVAVVGGAFFAAPAPPRIIFRALHGRDHEVDRLPPGTPLTVTVDLRRAGYPGLFALGPDRVLRWLSPPDGSMETYVLARPGRKVYFARRGLRPNAPGSWLFVHFLHDDPVTRVVRGEIVQALRTRFAWRQSPFEIAPALKQVLSSAFREVIAQPFTVAR